MATLLKQSTAVDVALGPFVDSTDGVTAKTALTISQADVRLKKNAAAWAQKNETTAAAHEENGWYEVNLNTTDTDTLGILVVAVNESGALPVWREFMVVTANIYDSFHSTDIFDVSVTQISGSAVSTSTAQLGVNVVQVSGDATAADNAEAFFDGTGYAGTNNVIPTVSSVTAVATGGITAASIAADAIGASELAADAATEIAAAVWDKARASHVAAGSFGEGVASVQGNVTGNVAGSVGSVTGAVGSVTGNVGGNVVGSVASVTGAVGSVTGAVGSVTGNVGGNVVGTLGNLAAGAKSDVKTEAVAALATDTYAELTDVPAATASLKDKITWLFMLGRNRITQTATTGTIYADDTSTALSTTTVSDDGTTAVRGEWTP